MKRVPISPNEFLRDVVAPLPLLAEERRLLERCLDSASAADQARLLRTLVDSLLAREVWESLGAEPEAGGEVWRLRDPARRVRMRVWMPSAAEVPGPRRLPFAADSFARPHLLPHQVQQLVGLQGHLLSQDRMLVPRELVGRVEQVIGELAPGASAVFHTLEWPSEQETEPVDAADLPLARAELEQFARERDHLLYWPLVPGDGSLLLVPSGDDGLGWRGCFAVRHPLPDAFASEQIERVVLAAQVFRNLLGTMFRLQGLVFYDVLTGIHNRSFFEEQFDRELSLARRREQSMAVLIADIDDFKGFNTSFGYDGGDRVLATVACVLKATLRGSDTLARYGGEEFAILLAPHVPRDEAERIAERLRSAVADEPLELAAMAGPERTTRPRGITISIGGAMHPDDGRTARELWNAANRRLLAAKAAGKDQVRFHDA